MIYCVVSYAVMALATVITGISLTIDYFQKKKRLYLKYRHTWLEARSYRPDAAHPNFLESYDYKEYQRAKTDVDFELFGFFLAITLIAPISLPCFVAFLVCEGAVKISDLAVLRFQKYWDEEAAKEKS